MGLEELWLYVDFKHSMDRPSSWLNELFHGSMIEQKPNVKLKKKALECKDVA